jgi:hypothetical protein
MKMRLLAGAAALALSAAGAQAATINSIGFSKANYDAQRALLGPNVVVEDFESYTDQVNKNVGNGTAEPGFGTKVGTFYTRGGTGSGGTVTDPNPDLDGTKLAIRNGTVYGRSSTTDLIAGAANPNTPDLFLDSNDTFGTRWVVNPGSMFNKLIFTLTDASDQGALMKITSNLGGEVEFQSLSDANRRIITVDFGGFVQSAEIRITNFWANGTTKKTNDGFSVDDIAVSVVPLPAPAFMLIAGLAGLAAFRRKRAAA